MLASTGRTSLAVAGKKVIVGIRFQTAAESAFGMPPWQSVPLAVPEPRLLREHLAALTGSVLPGKGPGRWAPSHCLGCSSEPPPISPPLAMQAWWCRRQIGASPRWRRRCGRRTKRWRLTTRRRRTGPTPRRGASSGLSTRRSTPLKGNRARSRGRVKAPPPWQCLGLSSAPVRPLGAPGGSG